MSWYIFDENLGSSISCVNVTFDSDVCGVDYLVEAVMFVNMKMVTDSYTLEHIKISSDLNFLRSNVSEFYVLNLNINSIVNIAPLRSGTELLAICCISINKV